MRKNYEGPANDKLRVVDYGLVMLGLLVLIFGLKKFSFGLEGLTAAIFLLIAICLAEFFKIDPAPEERLFLASGSINPRDGLVFAAVLLVQGQFLPYSNLLVAVVLGVLFGHLIKAADLGREFLGLAGRVPVVFYLTLTAISFFDRMTGGTWKDKDAIGLAKLIPITLGVLVFLGLQLGIDSIRLSLKTRSSIRWSWVETIRLSAPPMLVFIALGVLLALSYSHLLYRQRYPLGVVFFSLLMLGVLYLYKLRLATKEAYQAAVKTLSEAVEMQNPLASGHGRRVADYALANGRELNIHGQEYESLGFSALAHDIGRVGINENSLDFVLESPSLSEGEVLHARLGAEIIGQVDFLKENAEAVKMHHRPFSSHKTSARETGTIPLAARILNVADTFDQLVETRSLEERLNPDEAAARLKKESGLLLDPKIVRIFLSLLRKKGLLSEAGFKRRRR